MSTLTTISINYSDLRRAELILENNPLCAALVLTIDKALSNIGIHVKSVHNRVENIDWDDITDLKFTVDVPSTISRDDIRSTIINCSDYAIDPQKIKFNGSM